MRRSSPEPSDTYCPHRRAADSCRTPVINGLNHPSDIQSAADGSDRLFVLEQPGRIRIFQNGILLERPFLDITDRVGSNGSEQGLLGLAFHPKFAQNGWFYVNYTDFDGNTHIARFTASGDSADPASEKSILFVPQPFQNHNGGALAFGPDGNLYIGLGDGGSAGDPYDNAQSGNSLLGKILHIDVDHGEVNPEIWAAGLRNPWRFSFDHLTGDLWIGDVGQNLYEEVDFVAAGTPGGLNFGWKKMEGNHPYKGGNQPEFTAPVAEYSHAEGCAVTGGYVYRGAALPAWQGVYFYADYCSGTIWGLTSPPLSVIQPTVLFQTAFKISTFGVDDAGELYLADYTGAIYRLEKIQ
ncbi:MAG: PQQ-dependent sugar dehydrogenase [Chloroflexi bacterium]|nr:PQQ-dependent sugar dehydrogenase [Chloroflexota bacterium]